MIRQGNRTNNTRLARSLQPHIAMGLRSAEHCQHAICCSLVSKNQPHLHRRHRLRASCPLGRRHFPTLAIKPKTTRNPARPHRAHGRGTMLRRIMYKVELRRLRRDSLATGRSGPPVPMATRNVRAAAGTPSCACLGCFRPMAPTSSAPCCVWAASVTRCASSMTGRERPHGGLRHRGSASDHGPRPQGRRLRRHVPFHRRARRHLGWLRPRGIRARGPSGRRHQLPSSDYPTSARRPANSRLDCATLEADFGIPRPDWRESLDRVTGDLGDVVPSGFPGPV